MGRRWIVGLGLLAVVGCAPLPPTAEEQMVRMQMQVRMMEMLAPKPPAPAMAARLDEATALDAVNKLLSRLLAVVEDLAARVKALEAK